MRLNPGTEELQKLLATAPVDVVHLTYRQKAYEHASKDYEFSRASILEHGQAGKCDMADTFAHPGWLQKSGLDDGVTIYDWMRPPI